MYLWKQGGQYWAGAGGAKIYAEGSTDERDGPGERQAYICGSREGQYREGEVSRFIQKEALRRGTALERDRLETGDRLRNRSLGV